MSIHKQFRLIALGASCVAIGAGASAVASAGAATQSATTHPHHAHRTHAHRGRFAPRRAVRRAVHGDLLLATKKGFVTVTWDRGIVQSVNGQQLTLTEGRKTTTRTVTLTIPSNARIRDNGHKATLSQVSRGQRVFVVHGPTRTLVRARTPHTA